MTKKICQKCGSPIPKDVQPCYKDCKMLCKTCFAETKQRRVSSWLNNLIDKSSTGNKGVVTTNKK